MPLSHIAEHLDSDFKKLRGELEVDETYFGGSAKVLCTFGSQNLKTSFAEKKG